LKNVDLLLVVPAPRFAFSRIFLEDFRVVSLLPDDNDEVF
jgi:hypothetical protein